KVIYKHRSEFQVHIAREVETTHGYAVFAFEGKKKVKPVFKQKQFDDLIERLGFGECWPTTPNGHYSTDDEKVFKPLCKLCPELEPLRQARKSIKALALGGTIL